MKEDKEKKNIEKESVNQLSVHNKKMVVKRENKKNNSEWDNMKIFIFSHKRYILTLFPVVLISIFLGSLCSSLQKNGLKLFFVLCLIGTFLLLGLSVFMVTITKKKFVEYNVSLNVYLSIIFAYMFLSGLILMVLFKIVSIVNPKNIFNIAGLTTVIVLVIYVLLVVAAFYFNFEKVKKIFKRKKNK